MIKTFRGLLADGDQDTIRLGTNNGLTGYRIVRLDIIPTNPTAQDSEGVVTIFTRSQDAAGLIIDFSNSQLLGCGFWSQEAAAHQNPEDLTIIFDNVTFNQDIYINYKDSKTNDGMNYLLHLEQVKLDLGEAAAATLKDMRGSN
jgi:hypothetical protein